MFKPPGIAYRDGR